MKKKAPSKLSIQRETLKKMDHAAIVLGASNNRVCATYTEIIGPCVPTQGGRHCI